jgi:hypothetical protein
MAIGFDRAGSYRVPLLFFLFASLVAIVLMMRMGPCRYGRRDEVSPGCSDGLFETHG